ncbi:MAG: hypothetical protein OEW15_13685 [Nitrospirota bacterium]|nr:hypothetical protein [Nitrospirota bacterium]
MITQKFIPSRSSLVLERERLLGKLTSWSDKKVVIIQAPAGQGKSTLAADHVRSLADPAVWYTLDNEDGDPAFFLSRFAEALHRIFPNQVPIVPVIPRDRYRASDPSLVISQWIGRLFRDIPPGVIVFDNYHVLADSPATAELLSQLIETSPPGVRIMVLSRTKPEMALASLRSKRAVGELSAADLRFTDNEVIELFGSVFGTHLSRPRAADICRMTEGWAVGLVLLHEYLMTKGDQRNDAIPEDLQRGFRDQVFDYLANEVFSHLAPGLQAFLLRTSLAEAVPVPLACILTGLPAKAAPGRSSVSEMLAELARRNLFIDANKEGDAIRYHALFREFLAARFASSAGASDLRRAYGAAAAYFVRNGDPVRAAGLFIASDQHAKAANVLERSWRNLIARGQIRTLLQMIDLLPFHLQKRPWLLFARAVECRFSDPKQALSLYDLALAGFRREKNSAGQMLSLGGVIEAAFHSGGDFQRMERAVVQAQRILRKQERASPEARATLLLALGTAWFFTGKLHQGIDALRKATDLFRSTGDHFSLISCAIYLTPCALYHGDFQLAHDTVAAGFEAQKAATDEPGGEAALFLVQAMTSLFVGDFSAAQESLDAGRRIATEYRIESIDLLLLDIYGWLKIAQGDYRGAEKLLDECRQRGEVSAKAFFNLSASHFLALACLFQRKLDRAKKLSDHALAPGVRGNSRLFHAIYLIADGAILREQGEIARAELELQTAIRMLRQSGAAQQEANGHLILASLYLMRNKTAQAHRHLQLGFSIGEERGFTYYAPLAPRELHDLAQEAVMNGICAGYCAALLDRSRPAAAPLLRIHCLGGFRIERNGEAIREREWKGRQAKKLVKLLATGNGKPLSRDIVIETIWPNGDPARYAPVLSSLLHRVRKTLDNGSTSGPQSSCVRFDAEHLSLDRALVWTDIDAFRSAADEAFRCRNGKDNARSLRLYDHALAIYQGDLLPEDRYEDWTLLLRDDLRTTYLRMLEQAADIADNEQDLQTAMAYQVRLFDADQCNEKACRWLMTHAVANGLRGKAVRTYERCQLALRKELDIEPDERTRRLYRSIIGG